MGAIIVDPVVKRVIAQASTDNGHPTRHAVMVCIDQVAMAQGGGAWSGSKNKDKEPSKRWSIIYYRRMIKPSTKSYKTELVYTSMYLSVSVYLVHAKLYKTTK